MSVPFTVEQFFGVFADYNAAIWPAQVVAYALALLALGAVFADRQTGTRVILGVLATLWAWNGAVYHALYFATINPAANIFAALFVGQAFLFAAAALTKPKLRFEAPLTVRTLLAVALIVYALVVYPLIGHLSGHDLMKSPLFGVAPCPTTIFTLGMLLLTGGRLVAWLSIVPVAWALVGLSAAIVLDVPQDFGLGVAAVILISTLALNHWHLVSSSR